MFYLLLAIFGSGVIPVIFRAFEGWRVNLFWAIPVNYVTCIVIGHGLAHDEFNSPWLAAQPWIGIAAFQGFLLAVNFFLLAHTAQRAGVAIAALASRLAVAIPSLLAFALYGDSLTLTKFIGLLAALLALYLCTAPERQNGALAARVLRLAPLTVFVTFGCYFTILKYLQTYYLTVPTYHSYVMAGVFFALVTSLVIGGVQRAATARFQLLHVIAGLILGAINYLAVYSLLRVLAQPGWQSSQLYPIYSVGVVAVSTVLAFVCFRERLSRRKLVGLAVGLVAVGLLNR